MSRMTLYSSSRRAAGAAPAWVRTHGTEPASGAALETPSPLTGRGRVRRWRDWLLRNRAPLFAALGGLSLIGALILHARLAPAPQALTQESVDAAVLRTLKTATLPSAATKAHEVIRRSVVKVRGYGKDKDGGEDSEQNVGTGVVIMETGVILTNMHVVVGAERIGVVFADGTESAASVTGIRPEHDLAVLQARVLPDDLPAATMTTTGGLAPGDLVVAVGFPYGIGPSVSAGVVSGLRREYLSPQGKRILTNLIQFDAAANPGNSGGPLVNAKGEVVGIVTGVLNPTAGRFFVGIGFAVPIENAASAAGMPPF
jgi:serine protease Do